MPMPQSALDGIKRFGLGWKFPKGPKLSTHTAVLGRLADDGFESEDDEKALVRSAHAIAKAVEAWFGARGPYPDRAGRELAERYKSHHEEDICFLKNLTLEEVTSDPEETLQEVTDRLDSLWDTFDFYRVLVR